MVWDLGSAMSSTKKEKKSLVEKNLAKNIQKQGKEKNNLGDLVDLFPRICSISKYDTQNIRNYTWNAWNTWMYPK